MPEFERVDELLYYDPGTGILRWRVSPRFNVLEGSEVGCPDRNGYLRVGIEGRVYFVHQVAHLLMTGHWPDGNPEHENRIPGDNRWENIKDLAPSQSENGGNQGLRRNNTSGLKGVSWLSAKQKWMAKIEIRRKQINLGHFVDPHLAGLTYDAAAKLVWGLRFSNLNFPAEESEHIVLPDRVLMKLPI